MRAFSFLAVWVLGCSSQANPYNFEGLYKHDAGGIVAPGAKASNDPGDDGKSDPTPPPGHPDAPPDASAPFPPDSNDAGAMPTNDAGSGTTTPLDAGSGTVSTDVQHCIDDVNAYRAQLGLAPFTHAADLDHYAATAAASDAQSGTAHSYFNGNNGGGVASAENELPGWPLGNYNGLDDLIDQGMSAIETQEPGDVSSQAYTQMSCGIATTADQNVWVTLDFR